MTIKVVIADDHQLVREGLKRILALHSEVEVIGEFSNGDDVIQQADSLACDVLLLDISMPGASGIELIRKLRALRPALPILVVSMHNDVQTVRLALRVGASGYIDKSCSARMLITAIRSVMEGGRFIDPSLVDVLVSEATPIPTPSHRQLTSRELEILRLIVGGRSGGEIAEILYLSPKTVSTHKVRLMKKLNVSSTAALIQYAIAHGLSFC